MSSHLGLPWRTLVSIVACASFGLGGLGGLVACASDVASNAADPKKSDLSDDDDTSDDDDDTSDDDDDDKNKDAGRKDAGTKADGDKDADAPDGNVPPQPPSMPGLYINVDGESFGGNSASGMRQDGALGGGAKNGRSYALIISTASGFSSATLKIYPSGGGYPPVGKYPCSGDEALPSVNTSYVELSSNGTYRSTDRSCTVEITESSKKGVNDLARNWNIKGTITGELEKAPAGGSFAVSGTFDLDYSN